MRTYLECIPCFFNQLLTASKLLGVPYDKQKKILIEFSKKIPSISLSSPPPFMSRIGYKIFKEITQNPDPFKKVKKKSNIIALGEYENLKKKVSKASEPLLFSVEIAIAGNIIDFGAKGEIDINKEVKRIVNREKNSIKKGVFHFDEFKEKLKEAKTILYLGDNAGEVVFDRILIEEIKNMYPEKEIFYAVKERAAINDALIEDAVFCGIDKSAEIISNGTDAPGTILSLCSKEFLKLYRKADIIISKGQGNYETLSNSKRPIFFFFMVKCEVVARNSGCEKGSIVLLYNLRK